MKEYKQKCEEDLTGFDKVYCLKKITCFVSSIFGWYHNQANRKKGFENKYLDDEDLSENDFSGDGESTPEVIFGKVFLNNQIK